MKQLFLSLALLTSSFVYGADQNPNTIDLSRITFAELKLSSVQMEDLKKIAKLRGLAEPKAEDLAVDTLHKLIKPDKNFRRVWSGRVEIGNDHEWDVCIGKETDYQLWTETNLPSNKKAADEFFDEKFLKLIWKYTKNSPQDLVFKKAWQRDVQCGNN